MVRIKHSSLWMSKQSSSYTMWLFKVYKLTSWNVVVAWPWLSANTNAWFGCHQHIHTYSSTTTINIHDAHPLSVHHHCHQWPPPPTHHSTVMPCHQPQQEDNECLPNRSNATMMVMTHDIITIQWGLPSFPTLLRHIQVPHCQQWCGKPKW